MSPPEPRRVLIANLTMAAASGTVLYTRDLALALLRRGWTPVVYTSVLGPEATALRAATIPVVTDPAQLGAAPDVIHGHHILETLAAMSRFPGVPAVFVCHDALAWHSIPPRLRRIRAYIAVDRNCRDRMVLEHGIPEESVRVLTNPVDLHRFSQREPLPARPRRALVFSNQAHESFVGPIREACKERSIEVDVIGTAAGHSVEEPEHLLPNYDLVFGKARCAIEAAAAGCAVIVSDLRGMAGLLTMEGLEEMRVLNFGARTLQRPVTKENVLRELDRYDPEEAARVSRYVRQANDADLLAEQFADLYEEILGEPLRESAHEDLAGISAALVAVNPQIHAQADAAQALVQPLRRLLDAPLIGRPLRLVYRFNRWVWSR
jgi:hypothetical protein